MQITDETIGVHANQEVAIGGIVVRIRKIMICIKEWLLRYYYMAQRKAQNYFNRQMFSPVPIRRRNDRDYSDEEIRECVSIVETLGRNMNDEDFAGFSGTARQISCMK